MKNFARAALAIALCLTLSACGGNGLASASESDAVSVTDSAYASDESGKESSEERSASDLSSDDGTESDSSEELSDSSSDDTEASDSSDAPGDSSSDEKEESYTKVVLMAGQSNMLGCTFYEYLSSDNVGTERYERISKGFENVKLLQSPAASVDDFVSVRPGLGNQTEEHLCFGPELGMAEALSEAYPDETVYLLKLGVGGSSLFRDWVTKSRGSETYNYVYFKNIAESGLKLLYDAGLNPQIVAFCWMQGEADAEEGRPEWSNAYGSNLSAFVSDVRADFDSRALNGKVNFIDAYISDSPDWVYYNNVNGGKLQVSKLDSHNYLLDTLATGLMEPGVRGLIYNRENTTLVPDIKHYDSVSMLKLGNMFGNQIAEICG